MLSTAANTDPNIESLRVEGTDSSGTVPRFLRTSAEFAMKRMLAEGSGPIFELGRVFRSGECGPWHEPEFTMLEWYRPGYLMDDLIAETTELLISLFWRYAGHEPVVERHQYVSLFSDRTGLCPLTSESADLGERCRQAGMDPSGLTRDTMIDYLMAFIVQPSLAERKLHVISHYPADQAALARLTDDNPELAYRFEVFYGSVELANGYDELCDAEELERRFSAEIRKRQKNNQVVNPVDRYLIEATRSGIKQCSGIALGMDRLLMCLSGNDDISKVINFIQEYA